MSLRVAVCSFLLSSTLASKIHSSGEVSQRRSSEALLIAITAEEEPQSDTASALTHLLATGTTASATAGFNAVRQSLCQWYDSEHQIATDNEENMVKACRAKCGLEKVKANGHIQAFTVNKVNDKKAYCTCSSRGDCLDYLSCPNCVSYIMMDKFPWPFSSDSEESTTTAAGKTTENVTEAPTTAAPAAEDKPEKVKETPTTAAPASEEKVKEASTTAAPASEEKVKEASTTAAPAAEEKVKDAPTTAAPAGEDKPEKVKEAPTTAATAEEKEASTTTAPEAEDKKAKATTTEAATTLAETTSVKKSSTDAEASSFVNAKTHLRHKKSHKKKHSGKAHHKKHGSKDKKKSL